MPADLEGSLEFRILGPLEVWSGDRRVTLQGGAQRALLAALLLRANHSVSADRLIDELWGSEADEGAVKRLQVAISRLRRVLGQASAARDGDAALVTRASGYELRVGRDRLDADRFERLLAEGRAALRAEQPGRAAAVLRTALELWRGPAMADVSSASFAQAEIARLEDLRIVAFEERIEAELALHRHSQLVGELQALVRQHPARERFHSQLMLALYRSGRQVEALEVYRTAREWMVEELGLEPGPALQDLQQAILRQDPSLPAATDPPRPVAERRSRLPRPPNETVGRGHEIHAITERLRAGVRLLTLTGPGGIGKTRLAVETARAVDADFADGSVLVSLAALEHPDAIPSAIAQAIDVSALPDETIEEAVERVLAAKRMLLLLDNIEHLLPAAAGYVARLHERCPTSVLLVTSREALAVQAEHRQPVPPLAVPDPHELEPGSPSADAVLLFCRRAQARDPSFALTPHNTAAVIETCRRLDGLPLAIELAAARVTLLSPQEIADRLDALGGGPRDAPARHRTLQATIDWSHRSLDPEEQSCFARFSVFAGGATLDAAEAVTGAGLETLERLVDKSLLVAQRPRRGPARLSMLAMIKSYAAGRLAGSSDIDAVRDRHCRFYLSMAQAHGSERALCGVGRAGHRAVLDADIDNVHAALEWALERGAARAALEFVCALKEFWLERPRIEQAMNWVGRALRIPGAHDDPALRARALLVQAERLWPVGQTEECARVLAEAEALARELDDPLLISRVLQSRARTPSVDPGEAEALADEARQWARQTDDLWELAFAAYNRAMAAPTLSAAGDIVHEAAELLRRAGNIARLAPLMSSVAYEALCEGSDEQAAAYLNQAVDLTRELDSPVQWMFVRGNAGLAALFTGQRDEARAAFREELELCRRLVVPTLVSEGLLGLAAVAVGDGDDRRAARLLGAAMANSYGITDNAIDRRLRDRFFDPARARCGSVTWDSEVREGAAMGLDEATGYALVE